MTADALLKAIPSALHRGEEELPFVPYQDGVTFKLVQADVEKGIWVIRVRFEPGATIQRHKHTGEVFGFTTQGAWKYLEYPEINRAGSYLYEPAGSIHTLQALPSNKEITDVWFAIRGANLNLDAEGRVETVVDAAFVTEFYRAACRQAGQPAPNIIGA